MPLPESQPLDEATPHESSRVDEVETIDEPAPAADGVNTAQTSSTFYDRATQFIARRGALLVVVIAALLSVISFVYFFANGMTNHYGDGIAHVNIARKVVDSPDDSLWQRYLQIGTPWLPLQTVLMLPLVAFDGLWRSGAAGSLVSMAAFVIAAAMTYRIAWNLYGSGGARLGVWMAAVSLLIFALNPSALFMQATPMTETVFMAAVAAAVFCLQRWMSEQPTRRLIVAGAVMTVATLARYEAWPVALLSVLIVALASRGARKARLRATLVFAALVSAGPLYWLWHNWAIFGNPIEFLSGPHSARGIFLHEEARLGWAKIFIGHPLVSLLWMAITTAVCSGPFVLLLAAVGFVAFVTLKRRSLLEQSPAILLAVPFLFHAFSVMRGEIQIFPFSAFGLLNVRYGLPHLLAVAAFTPAVVWLFKPRWRRAALAVIAGVVVLQYVYLISEGPAQLAVYQEGYRNGVNSARAREWARAAAWLEANPPRQTVWMNTGALGPLVPRGGLRFAQIIHEGSLRWHAINAAIPADVTMIIYQEGDPVAERLKNDAALAADFGAHFRQQFSYDSIRVFTRKE
ncbi:MAG TPA: glycosyltransferase family 39 protein [Blastocatellia bacterium]|nr:glycosyltransferase family 39 protein [Blastocatellia bacterium]